MHELQVHIATVNYVILTILHVILALYIAYNMFQREEKLIFYSYRSIQNISRSYSPHGIITTNLTNI